MNKGRMFARIPRCVLVLLFHVIGTAIVLWALISLLVWLIGAIQGLSFLINWIFVDDIQNGLAAPINFSAQLFSNTSTLFRIIFAVASVGLGLVKTIIGQKIKTKSFFWLGFTAIVIIFVYSIIEVGVTSLPAVLITFVGYIFGFILILVASHFRR